MRWEAFTETFVLCNGNSSLILLNKVVRLDKAEMFRWGFYVKKQRDERHPHVR